MVKVKIDKSNKQRMSKEKKKILTYLVLSLIIPFFAGSIWFWHQTIPFNSPGKDVNIDVRSGMGVAAIAEELEKKGVVGSRHAFRIYVRFNNPGIFKTGRYVMKQNLGSKKAAELLDKAPEYDYFPIVIQPGVQIDVVQAAITRTEKLSGDKFLQVLNQKDVPSPYAPENVKTYEGLFLPETYFSSDTETELDFAKRASQALTDAARILNIEAKSEKLGITPYQAYTIASLIEREARSPGDRAKVASVIYNRIKIDMLLQIDATLLYSKGLSTGSLSNADKKVDSPYNTYLYKGIPPTPISTFTKESLEAALNPSNTDFLFYVLTNAKTGEHKFTKTLAEHNAAVKDAQDRGVF